MRSRSSDLSIGTYQDSQSGAPYSDWKFQPRRADPTQPRMIGGLVLHQVNRRSPEPSAGQPRAVATLQSLRDIHQRIQFRGAVLEKVARAFVALVHILAELRVVAIAQRAFAENHALNFTDDVISALIFAFGQLCFVGR